MVETSNDLKHQTSPLSLSTEADRLDINNDQQLYFLSMLSFRKVQNFFIDNVIHHRANTASNTLKSHLPFEAFATTNCERFQCCESQILLVEVGVMSPVWITVLEVSPHAGYASVPGSSQGPARETMQLHHQPETSVASTEVHT